MQRPKRLLLLLLIVGSLLFLSIKNSRITHAQGGSALQTVAATLQAGGWAQLPTNGRTITSGNGADQVNGYNLIYPNPSAADGNLAFAPKWVWDSARHVGFF